ncbi:MAG: DNA integrity scanning diadenylate cyclase DisA [Candidatus Bipolaricaulia bacterium]
MSVERDRGSKGEIIEVLKQLSPGTSLREAIDNIVELESGGLIAIADKERIEPIIESSFEMDTDFTPQKLTELAKMDMAVVIDENLKKIIYANAYLIPDTSIPSQERGTRHRAADKVAKQLGVAVIAISEQRERVTIYYNHERYILRDIATVNSNVNQALQILEQHRMEFDRLIREITTLELVGRVLPYHVASVIQKIIQMLETREEIERLFVELGEVKVLPERQLEGLMLRVWEELQLLIEDFKRDETMDTQEIGDRFRELGSEVLLSLERAMNPLGYEGEEDLSTVLPSRGYRVLSKIPRLPMSVIERLVTRFDTLENILSADRDSLQQVRGVAEVRASAIKSGLQLLRSRFFIFDEL